jgi:hypothetical protein
MIDNTPGKRGRMNEGWVENPGSGVSCCGGCLPDLVSLMTAGTLAGRPGGPIGMTFLAPESLYLPVAL